MEEQKGLYSIGNLRAMEIIEINTGAKLGFIKDLKIDSDQCKIISIVLPSVKMPWFGKSDDIEIPWGNVKKIGIDVVLVDGGDFVVKD